MGKIVFFCIPAQGHINPTLGVVRELKRRGHQIWYYSYENMREKIEAAGATFVPCDSYTPQAMLTPEEGERLGKDLAFSINLIVEMTLALDEAILMEMERIKPQVIVADSMAFWGKLIAQKLGIPFVSSTTTFAFNRYSAKVMKQGGAGLLTLLKAQPKIHKDLKRLRKKGYAVKSVLSIIANDNATRTLVYTAPSFQPCEETFSDKYSFVGPLMRPILHPIAKTSQPTIFISAGSVLTLPKEFYQNCIQALGDGKRRVILSVGERTELSSFGELPSHVTVCPQVDQMAALAVSDVFITHCGMNSVNEALWYGVPMVLYPQTAEQQGVANRVIEKGAGLALKSASPEAVLQAVSAVLEDPTYSYSAKALSRDFQQCGGAEQAADVIEKQMR